MEFLFLIGGILGVFFVVVTILAPFWVYFIHRDLILVRHQMEVIATKLDKIAALQREIIACHGYQSVE